MKTTVDACIDFELELPDFWQGAGTCTTHYSHVVVGVGASENAAFDDAVDQLAMEGFSLPPDEEDEKMAECSMEIAEGDFQFYCTIHFNEEDE